MTSEEFQKKVDNVLEKVGNDAGNLILDDIGLMITDNKNMNDELAKKDQKIQELQKMNTTLQNVNGNLLQQVSMGVDREMQKEKEQEAQKTKEFNYADMIDKNGKFKQKL